MVFGVHRFMSGALSVLALCAAAEAQLIVGVESSYVFDAVWRIDVATGERALLFYGGASAIGVDDAGGRIFAANLSQLSVWSYGGGQSATVLGTVRDPSGLQFRPTGLAYAGGRLFASKQDLACSGWLHEIDLTTLVATPVSTASCLDWVEEISFEPSSGQFVLHSDSGQLFRMDILGGGAPQPIASIGFGSDGGALGPNGMYYVLHDGGGVPITEFDLNTGSFTSTSIWAPYFGSGDNAGADWAPSLVVPSGPRVYCAPSLLGSQPKPTYVGSPSASAGSGFTITHTPIPGGSLSRVHPHISLVGPAQAPFLTGKRCLKLPVLRLPPASNANGVHNFDFNAYIASGANPALVAGQSVWYQVVVVQPNVETRLGPGVSFTIQP